MGDKMKINAIFLLLLLSASAFCQAADDTAAPKTEPAVEFQTPQNFSAKEAEGQRRKYFWIFDMGPIMTVNTESRAKSAPSPIAFSCGMGVKLFTDQKISFTPEISFFTNYYLWDGKNALPAEVENRTATVLSFLIDLPAVYNIETGKDYSFEAGAGLAFLARYGLLSHGVKSSDPGVSGDAKGDVEKINGWLMSDMRFLFPELTGAWNYKISERLQAGLAMRIYFPLGSLINGRGLDAMMIRVSARLLF